MTAGTWPWFSKSLTDNNINYSLGTYGEIVALTRKVIINDDLQAFTRVPALLGVAAAQLEGEDADHNRKLAYVALTRAKKIAALLEF